MIFYLIQSSWLPHPIIINWISHFWCAVL